MTQGSDLEFCVQHKRSHARSHPPRALTILLTDFGTGFYTGCEDGCWLTCIRPVKKPGLDIIQLTNYALDWLGQFVVELCWCEGLMKRWLVTDDARYRYRPVGSQPLEK